MVMTEIPAPPPPFPDPTPPPPAEAPVAAQPEESAAPVPVPEPEPQAQSAPEPEAAPAEPDPVQSALEEIQLQLEEQKIQNQLMEKRLEQERILRDDAASKAGYYKRVATDLASSRRTAQEPEYLDESDPARVAPETARFQQELQSLRDDAIERAQVEALNQFFASNPDARDMQTSDLQPFVVQARAQYAQWLESGEPKLIRRAAQMTLETAYLNAQKARIAAKRTERLTARASQLEKLAGEKRAANIPGSGRAAPSGAKAKTIDKLDPYGKEIEDILDNWR